VKKSLNIKISMFRLFT